MEKIAEVVDLAELFTDRARVRDDSGRSPQIELEPERSF